MGRLLMGLFHLLLLIPLKSFANAGTTNPTENVQRGSGSLPAVLVLVISLMLLTLGSALVTFHYCRKGEEEEDDSSNEADESKKEKLDDVEDYDQLTYDKMDDGDEEWAVKTTKPTKEVATVEVDENSYMYDIGEESGSYVV